MRIFILVMIAALAALPAMAVGVVNGTCDLGNAEVSATEGSTTALTGWTFNTTVGGTVGPIGNWYIGKNVRDWNQRPGFTSLGIGMAYHANPAPSGVVRECKYTQTVTGLQANKQYNLSGWMNSPLPTGAAGGGTLKLGVQTPGNPGWMWSSIIGDDVSERNTWLSSDVVGTASGTGTLDIAVYITLGYGGDGWGKSTPMASFDDITLTIPEPSSVLALLTGLPILGYAIRRRKA